MKKYLWLCFVFALGCASKLVPEGPSDLAQWEAKAQIKDLKDSKTHQVSLDIVSRWPDAFRMEVTGTLGVSVASLVIRGQQVGYILPKQKKAFAGKISDKSLAPLFDIDLNPQLLLNVCFDKPIEGKEWVCSRDDGGKVKECRRESNSMTVSWLERDGDRKRVIIQSPSFEVQMVFKSYSTKVQNKNDLFALRPPSDFRRYKLP